MCYNTKTILRKGKAEGASRAGTSFVERETGGYTDAETARTKAIVGQDITFSRFVILACEYALNNMEKEDKEKTSK